MPAPTPELDELGTMIRAARVARKLNQTELGEKLGLSQAAVSDIENGTAVSMDVVLATAISKALGLPLAAVVHNATLRGERHKGRADEQRQGVAPAPDLDVVEEIDFTDRKFTLSDPSSNTPDSSAA